MVMPSITICTFLTLTNSFKLFDQNMALNGGDELPPEFAEALGNFAGRIISSRK